MYIDIGAHHPIRFSNTFLLYLNGWHGINIDLFPDCMNAFDKYRKDDINLNRGVFSTVGNLEYYSFEEPAYNTTDPKAAETRIKNKKSKLKEKISIKAYTMEYILDIYALSSEIDILTVDVEGCELDVLKPNNWEKYRPHFILIESLIMWNGGFDHL